MYIRDTNYVEICHELTMWSHQVKCIESPTMYIQDTNYYQMHPAVYGVTDHVYLRHELCRDASRTM